jgi:hypothetical protein
MPRMASTTRERIANVDCKSNVMSHADVDGCPDEYLLAGEFISR